MDGCSSQNIFSAVKYKAFDYGYERSTSLKVMQNLMSLPTLYVTSQDVYPHCGKVPWTAYRTPWIREHVISNCKLLVSGSLLEDLPTPDHPHHFLESCNIWISKSHSMSKDQTEEVIDPCQEIFIKWTTAQMEPESHRKNTVKDLHLPEELMASDYLPEFRGQLPSLKTKLSRLMNLPVMDPLLTLKTNTMSVVKELSCCAAYETTPDVFNIDPRPRDAEAHEEFFREPLLQEESLLLPAVVDSLTMTTESLTSYSSICGHFDIASVQMEEQTSVMDVLCQDASPAVDIFPFDITIDSSDERTTESCLMETTIIEHQRLPSEMELDEILAPKTSPSQLCLKISDLKKEELSPLCMSGYLLNARAQDDMERALWKSEKHPMFVVGLLLAEPQTVDQPVKYDPWSEALKILSPEKQIFTTSIKGRESQMIEDAQLHLGNMHDFTETLASEFPDVKLTHVEEFEKLSHDHDQFESTLMSPASLSQSTDSQTDKVSLLEEKLPVDTVIQREVSVNTTRTKKHIREDEKFKTGENTSNRDHPVKLSAITAVTDENNIRMEQSSLTMRHSVSSILNMGDSQRQQMRHNCPLEQVHDPLFSFMVLRSQQTTSGLPSPRSSEGTIAPKVVQETLTTELEPIIETEQRPKRGPAYISGAVSGNARREQEETGQWREVSQTDSQSEHQEKPESRVMQVQATETQLRAFSELFAVARPCLNSVREMGLRLPVCGDFHKLAPDQTHFLLKQQEKALCEVNGPESVVVQAQDLLRQTALIHILVTSKELLLKCSVTVAVAYLIRAVETSPEECLESLLKRLQIILFLSNKHQDPELKLQELQQLLTSWLQRRIEKNRADKILVILSVDCDETRATIINGMNQVAGASVTSLSPEENVTAVNGASVVSRVCDSVCAVMYERHIGPDFPWNGFSLVVEYDHPGQSPWSTVCREKNIGHISFNTVVTDTDNLKRLEDLVPYVLFVTEELLNSPLLLQTLETEFNITVLERSHSPSLQILGGTQYYSVITVDESTAIIIQDENELHQEKASERLVTRLISVSLQYSRCWFILHCPDLQDVGLQGEAYKNLVLLYSSLRLFEKSRDLQVKVLIVSEVLEIAKWISHICFNSLMSSDRELVSYLDREWLNVMMSQEEMYLLEFPCINPLVGQLMLRRAPSFQWLLRASLPELKELLPEVSHKVIKLFTDITCLYSQSTNIGADSGTKGVVPQGSQPTPFPPSLSPPHPEPISDHCTASFLFETEQAESDLTDRDPTKNVQSEDFNLQLDLNSFGSSDVSLRSGPEPWEEEETFSGWRSRSGAVGRVVSRAAEEWTPRPLPDQGTSSCFNTVNDFLFKLDSTYRPSPVLQQLQEVNTQTSMFSPDFHHVHDLSPVTDTSLWGRGERGSIYQSINEGMIGVSPKYGSKCWIGGERKRSGEAAGHVGTVLMPLKMRRLSFERVPGRSDGQTRLKLF